MGRKGKNHVSQKYHNFKQTEESPSSQFLEHFSQLSLINQPTNPSGTFAIPKGMLNMNNVARDARQKNVKIIDVGESSKQTYCTSTSSAELKKPSVLHLDMSTFKVYYCTIKEPHDQKTCPYYHDPQD